MEKNFFTMALCLCLSLITIMTSCADGDDLILDLYEPTQPTEPTNPDDDVWESFMDSYWKINGSYDLVSSFIKTERGTEDGTKKNTVLYCAEMPFNVTLGSDIYMIVEDEKANEFINLASVDPRSTTYGDWYTNAEGDSIRSVYTSQDFECYYYTKTLNVQNGEAYRFIDGKRDSFLNPVVVTSYAGSSSSFSEIERNDSIFNRETIKDSVRISFGNRSDIKPFVVSSKAVIDHFVKVKEKEEDMPEPDIWVEGYITYISARTASPIFISETSVNWYEICIVKTTQKTYVVANGEKVSEWSNDELANVNWHSAIYDQGYTNKWVPANISVDGTGWTYVLQFANGTHRQQTVWMNNALISSLKSFSNDNNAAQTPYLNSAAAVKREFSNGTLYSVTGTYSFTVAAK